MTDLPEGVAVHVLPTGSEKTPLATVKFRSTRQVVGPDRPRAPGDRRYLRARHR